jgi:Flp pilus assembly protein TadG
MRFSRLARRLRRNWLAAEEGMAAVEFALVAPLLLTLAFGIVVFSLYLAAWLGVIHAAAEGARASVAGMGAAERQTLAAGRIQAVVAGYAPLLDTAKVQVAYPAAASGYFSVSVTYPVVELGLARYAALAPVPALSPTRTATVTTGGY